ncbi:putative uncharacterized protein [Burkholderiales bacterium GJ-E10]|nr:putative uncharacterized protein [Burkholderiales bacterium GJ-E10]
MEITVTVTERQFREMQEPGGRRSKIAPFAQAIRNLAHDGYTVSQIREFLALNKVQVSATTVMRFLQKNAPKTQQSRSVAQQSAGTAGEGATPAASTPVSVAGVASTPDVAPPPSRITKYSTAPIVKPNIDLRDESTWPKPKAGAASGAAVVQRPVGMVEDGGVPVAGGERHGEPPEAKAAPVRPPRYGQIIKRDIDLRDPSTW